MRRYFNVVLVLMMLLIWTNSCHAQQPVSLDTSNRFLTTIRFVIPELSRHRVVRIFFPSSYYASSRKYPVIYMQDGQSLFYEPEHHSDSWYVDSLVNSFPANRQVIIVGIGNGGNKHRMTEYNPYDGYYGREEGVLYTKFIVNVIKPYIDQHYKTKASVKNTAIVGSSMGGIIAMYAAVKFDNVFGYAGILSPAFWVAPQIYQDVANSPINHKSMFFFSCGSEEGNETDQITKMDSILRKKNLSAKNLPAPLILRGAKHNEQQWRMAFDLFYKWFVQ